MRRVYRSAAAVAACCLLAVLGGCPTSASPSTYPASCKPSAARLDCGRGDQQSCVAANCCWNPVQSLHTANMSAAELAAPPSHMLKGTPWCYGKQAMVGGYSVQSVTDYIPSSTQNPGWNIQLALYDGAAYFGEDIKRLSVDVTLETRSRIRVKITDAQNARWEIPEDILPLTAVDHTTTIDNANYAFSWTAQPFGFAVTRVDDQVVVFNTTAPIVPTTSEPLFNGLIFSDQYLEISTQLPNNPILNGLGEKVTSLKLKTNGQQITFWARDAATPVDQNIYGSHPVVFDNRRVPVGNNQTVTRTSGTWLRNSNGMDVVIHDAQSALRTAAINGDLEETDQQEEEDLDDDAQQLGYMTWRVIGGVLDFFIYVNDATTSTPEGIVQQYQQSVGLPHMPPFWSLGFHQCRWGYSDIGAVQTMVDKYAAAGLPLDTAWTDIDYMDQFLDFTTDPVNFPTAGLASFANKLHSQGQKYVVIIDPGIANRTDYPAFQNGVKQDVFIKRASGELFIGKVWPGYTAFPSFYAENAQQWWTDNIVEFRKQVPVDGLWIDMNEYSNFCTGVCEPTGNDLPAQKQLKKEPHMGREMATESVHKHGRRHASQVTTNYNQPPYSINNAGNGAALNTLTIDVDAVHGRGFVEYNVHNMAGLSEAIATNVALESSMNERSLIISRSTFSGSGKHTGHWLGDNFSTYDSMIESIAGILAMNMFGLPLVGSDICGFNGNTNEELCARWMALGAFYPFSRNHNSKGQIDQEPYTWASVEGVSKLALGARYSLLHVYNTLFFGAHTVGGTVARPLFFQFGNDAETLDIDRQFMIGSSLLITPVLAEGVDTVTGYFPPLDNFGNVQTWYDWWTFAPLVPPPSGLVNLEAPLSTIPVHVCGGSILPLQQPALNTVAQASNPFSLLVALSSARTASGTLFLDDGVTLAVGASSLQSSFALTVDGTLSYTLVSNTYAAAQSLRFTSIDVLGVTSAPKKVVISGSSVASSTWDSQTRSLHVPVSLPLGRPFTVDFTW